MIKKIYDILDKHQRSRMLMLIIMILGGAFFETFGVSAVLPLVTAVTNPSVIDENAKYRYVYDLLGLKDIKTFILVMAIGLVFVYIIKNLYLILLNIAQNHFITNNQRRISVRLMKCYMKQEYLFHVDHNVSELRRNIEDDVNNFITFLTNSLQLVTEILVCGLLTIYLMIQDFVTTILLMVLMAGFMLVYIKIVRKRFYVLGQKTRDLTAERTKFFLESFGGVKEIKASSKENFFIGRYDRSFKEYAKAAQGQMLMTYIPKPLMESLCISGLLLFMAVRIVLGADVNRFVPVMSVFAVAAIRMLPSFNRISGNLNQIMFNKPSLQAVLNELKEMDELNKQVARDQKDIRIEASDIKVENVSFHYPAKPDKQILDNVSLDIPLNKAVAFVGASGAGKTTLADIILGVMRPQTGRVLMGNVNVLEHLDSWHDIIGYIPQAIFLTDDTVRANVAFGVPKEEVDDDKVWRALEEAQIADYVRAQKDGLDSLIGDRGVKISGGQRQRIGIARALYFDPKVIILDEATSALDNDTEKAVMDAIYTLSGKKTMIIIAHRLSTISKCQIIYEVEDGKVRCREYEDLVK